MTGYKGTEATLNWNAVEGADYYVYNLFYFSMETFKYEYLKKDERVDGTSVTVTGLDSKETYFWQVATVKDGMQSAYSDQSTIKITKQAPRHTNQLTTTEHSLLHLGKTWVREASIS